MLRESVGHDPVILPGAVAIVEDEEGRILMTYRADFAWLTGGAVGPQDFHVDPIGINVQAAVPFALASDQADAAGVEDLGVRHARDHVLRHEEIGGGALHVQRRARAVGAGRPEETGAVLRRGLVYALWIGLAAGLILGIGGPPLLDVLGLDPTLAKGAAPPLVIRNAQVITVTKGSFRGEVAIRDGRIAAVGEKVLIPPNAQVLDAIDELSQTYTGDRRWRIEHAQIVDPADIPRFARLGVIASMQPVHPPGSAGLPLEPTISLMGRARWPWAFAWAAIRDRGVPIAFGTDWPVSPLDPLYALHCALTRRPWAADMPDQRLSLAECLANYCATGAFALFGEAGFGTVAPGQAADLILVEGALYSLAGARPDARVVLTMAAGRVVHAAEGWSADEYA